MMQAHIRKGTCTMLEGREVGSVFIDILSSFEEAGLFRSSEICIITPYREQATMIRQAFIKAGANETLFERGILKVRIHTIDSIQGGRAAMVIVDFVLTKRRIGRYGFFTNHGHINVSVTRAKYF